MADVKWIKLSASIFSNRKIKQIRKLPEGDAIIGVWLQILCLAGQINDSGMVYFSKDIPYTEEMLAVEFDRPINIIKIALATFESFKMIEVIDNILLVSNWEKYQSASKLEEIKEQNRLRQQRHRERQKQLVDSNVTDNVKITLHNATDKELELDKELDIDKEMEKKPIHYQEIADLYNSICLSFPRLTKLSDTRKKAIKARLNTYTIDDFEKLFTMAEESDFLKGKNDSNWSATFDWLTKDSNMAKVLDGNFKNNPQNKPKPKTNQFTNFPQREYTQEQMSDINRKLLNKSLGGKI